MGASRRDDKGGQKGDYKGKSKGKDRKGKSKKGQEKGKGKSEDRSKGKGKSDKQSCGRFGHFARNCWQNQQVRAVGNSGQQQQSAVQGSPTWSAGGSYIQVSNASQQGQSQSQGPSSQYGVAQIMEDDSTDLVFDLTVGAFDGGHVRAIHFHDDEMEVTEFPRGIRAIIEELPDDSAAQIILLESGADASVFPLSLIGAGKPLDSRGTRLCDAQRKQIPIESRRKSKPIFAKSLRAVT